jgi:hypothetical protein
MYFENRYSTRTIRWLLWPTTSVQNEQMIYAAARGITEHKAAEELRVRTISAELLDAKLAALTHTGELCDVVDRLGDCAETSCRTMRWCCPCSCRIARTCSFT